jgi:hypothetical protein
MELIVKKAGSPPDYSQDSISTVATIAGLRNSSGLIQPRLRRSVFPPILLGTAVPAGDALLWLTDTDDLGFKFGTALTMPSPGSVRGLFQDGQERTFSQERRIRLDNQLFVLPEGINYFVGDEVLVNIHDDEGRQPGVVLEVIGGTAKVRLDDTNEEIFNSLRHIVLTGPGLDVPQVESVYNVDED